MALAGFRALQPPRLGLAGADVDDVKAGTAVVGATDALDTRLPVITFRYFPVALISLCVAKKGGMAGKIAVRR